MKLPFLIFSITYSASVFQICQDKGVVFGKVQGTTLKVFGFGVGSDLFWKGGDERKRKKSAYKIINWSEYNQSLKRRGNLSLYFPRGDLKEAFYNEAPYVKGLAGRDVVYKPAYTELIFTFYRLMNLGLLQITGFFEDRWSCQSLDIPVPSFGQLSDLFSELPVKTKHFCEKVKEWELIAKVGDGGKERDGVS